MDKKSSLHQSFIVLGSNAPLHLAIVLDRVRHTIFRSLMRAHVLRPTFSLRTQLHSAGAIDAEYYNRDLRLTQIGIHTLTYTCGEGQLLHLSTNRKRNYTYICITAGNLGFEDRMRACRNYKLIAAMFVTKETRSHEHYRLKIISCSRDHSKKQTISFVLKSAASKRSSTIVEYRFPQVVFSALEHTPESHDAPKMVQVARFSRCFT